MRFQHRVLGALGVNSFLIGAEDTSDCAVIDPAVAEPVIEALQAENLNCVAILLTHGHFDHIGGVKKLKEFCGAPVYVHEADAPMLGSSRLNLGVLMGDLLQPVNADVLLKGGETLSLAGLTIGVLHTPGHTKGGVCYALKQERILFVGDTLFHDGAGRTDFPGGSYRELYHSIHDTLFSLDGDYHVYSGHEEDTTLEYERKHNPFVQTGRIRGW